MRIYDIIVKKREGKILSEEEIQFFITEYSNENIPDYQAAALLMAIFLKGMVKSEITALTLAMMNSGDVIDLSKMEGLKVDKHSTGGVGDKVSIMLGPLVAACGVPVAKLSGRGLGHTGGTIDKLESFKGFGVELTQTQFEQNVNEFKIAIAGQTANLVPADKKLYALRDVTATVDNVALIASSIMSKKLASGADAIVLDVKCGNGSFNKTFERANELAQQMIEIGENVGKKTTAVISNMEQPLGNAIGNSLEVIEAIETLKGKGSEELLELCMVLGTEMLLAGQYADTKKDAFHMLDNAITSGKALEKLKKFIEIQGGDSSPIYDYSKFEQAAITHKIIALETGYICELKAEKVGIASLLLGAGRETKESTIDLSAGIILNYKMGDFVTKGDVLALLYTNKKEALSKSEALVLEAYSFSTKQIEKPSLILEVLN